MNGLIKLARYATLALSLTFATASLAASGAETAAALQLNYTTTRSACDDPTVPAHACSGVLLRTTRPSANYHTWNNSPNSLSKGGVAFSYLRADAKTSRLAEDGRSGYTLYPLLLRPKTTYRYYVLCAYPIDGDSWTRDLHGCGDNANTDTLEQVCHEQGITTAEAWVEQFMHTQDYTRQCAFDVQKHRVTERAEAFYQALRAINLLAYKPFPWNEIILATWDEKHSSRLPIQSFFYIDNSFGGLENAQHDQADWHQATGQWVPVINLQLPQDDADDAVFTYNAHDQRISEPETPSGF